MRVSSNLPVGRVKRRMLISLFGLAAFENPLTLAKGSKAISEMFALLSLVPGSMHSESGEVAEASGYSEWLVRRDLPLGVNQLTCF